MDFNLSEEERLLDDMVREFIDREYTFEKRRKILESEEGFSPDIWRQLAELGLLGIGISEAQGGVDAGPVATMLVMDALGAGLVLEPYLTSAVVASALLRHIDDPKHSPELLTGIAAGQTIVALAHREAGARDGPEAVATVAEPRGNGYALRGSKAFVAHAQIADALIVSARIPGTEPNDSGVSLFRVPRGSAGLEIRPYKSIDGQLAADIELKDIELPADACIGRPGGARDALERADDAGLAAVCAEAVGAMQAVLDTTAEYLRTRQQFGRPIGRFQALQHRAADMLIHCEQARSMSYLATLRCLDADRKRRRHALSAAKVLIARACRFVGQQAIQLHGGMGVTDELSVSHYFKRLTAIELAFGDADYHIDRFIETSAS